MSTSKKTKPNPWNKTGTKQPKANFKQPPGKKHAGTTPTSSSTEKFIEARKKLQESVQKHIKEYESSSSDEEDLETTNILLGKITENYYTTTGGNPDEKFRKTETFLKDNLLSGPSTCLICISKVKRDDPIWTCDSCFCLFHLMCIQRWSKDSVTHKKQALEGQILVLKDTKIFWGCPKCRKEYPPDLIPAEYKCFCGKKTNPVYQTLLAPHSCGEICRKELEPPCGHRCLLLCHPGPCPPCPVTVNAKCYCGAKPPRLQRCSDKYWSCGGSCGKLLECGKHNCDDPCHSGDCKPCPKKSIQKCMCKSQAKLRDCSSPIWQCEKVCHNILDCGLHKCLDVCHAGECNVCLLSLPRTCPCGKTKYHLPCTEETPTCLDTCDKILECGKHRCILKCHKDKCGNCLETVEKQCRCGQHTKEIQCSKPFLCETKCKKIRDCNKHPCNKKCCDGTNCPPCEKPCGKTLNCGNHKCSSVCHRGPCYPCSLTETVSCNCGGTKMTVPCGRKYKVKPPKCSLWCKELPDCHHEAREPHKCHFGNCPPCRQICDRKRKNCAHFCPALCHDAVMVKIDFGKASAPWEEIKPQKEKKQLPCPECFVPVPVECLGGHEVSNWPCHLAKPGSCFRPCGRLLLCQNHRCTLPCHFVENAIDDSKSGSNCELCENGCSKERLDGCQHECPKPCHPDECPPCKQMVRIKCFCGLTQPYVQCSEFIKPEKRDEIQSCGNQCPNNYNCGHRCKANCHPGPCPDSELCKKKIKVFCKCKRLKKEFSCESVRKNLAIMECDDVCAKIKEETQRKNKEKEDERKKMEEIENLKEIEKYMKKFEGKKKNRDKKHYVEDEKSFLKKYSVHLSAFGVFVISLLAFTIINL